MEKNINTKHIRNPFAGATDEKKVWKDLLTASKPVSKEEFSTKVKDARKGN
jgi:hypothetical protein